MYDYNRIGHEAHERAQRRQHEAAAERIAQQARASRRRRRRLILAPALRYLHLHRRGSLEAEI
jgi:hypothetical protein